MSDLGEVRAGSRALAVALGVGVVVLLVVALTSPWLHDGHEGLGAFDFDPGMDEHGEPRPLTTWVRGLGFVASIGLLLGLVATATAMVAVAAGRGLPAWFPAPGLGLFGLFTALCSGLLFLLGAPVGMQPTSAFAAAMGGTVFGLWTAQRLSDLVAGQEIASLERAISTGRRAQAIACYDAIVRRRIVRTALAKIALVLFLIVFVGLHLLGALASYLMVAGTVPEGETLPSWARLAGWANVLYGLAVAGVVVITTIRFRGSFWRRAASKQVRSIGKGELPSVRRLLDEIQAAMGLSRVPVTLWLDVAGRGAAPSVTTTGSVVHLVVSPRLVAMASARAETVRAMLAHELAHVRQRDASLWPLSIAIAQTTTRVILPLMVVGAALGVLRGAFELAVATNAAEAAPTLVGVVVAFLPLVAVSGMAAAVYRARIRTEILADLGAILFASPAGLHDAVSALDHLPGIDHGHEPPEQRRLRAARCIGQGTPVTNEHQGAKTAAGAR